MSRRDSPTGRRTIPALAFLLAGCASRPARLPAPSPSPPNAADAGAATLADPAADLPTLDVLAARGNAEIARMRELTRIADATQAIPVEARGVDTCFRAIVASSAPVTAHFEDAGHAVRGEPGPAGLVPPRGPVCARKGERLLLVVDPRVPSRAVIWQSP